MGWACSLRGSSCGSSPGVWGISFQDENADAQPFWERVATDAVGDRWHLEKGAGPEGRTPDIWLSLDTRSAL